MSQFNFPPCPLPAMSRVWVYLRDSGGETQDLASQRAYVDAYCQHHRLQVEYAYEDAAISGGSTSGRDAFEAMIDTARGGDGPAVDGVLYWDMKRFARNQLDSQFYMAELRRKGYRLVSISDDIPDNEFSGVVEAFLQWKAEKDRQDISKDTKRGLAYIVGLKNDDGRYIGVFPGRPPTFFATEPYDTGLRRNDGRPRIVQRLVPDPATWELGKQVWQMRAQGLGYREIEEAVRLFPESGQPSSTYYAIFKNEIYIGRLHYGGRIYEDFVPALATPEQWEAVQAQRYSRKKGNSFASKAGKTQYLLSGLCKCFYCQSSMHGGQNKRKDRQKYWRFYVCGSKWGRRDSCISKQMSAERLESVVIEIVSSRVLTVDFIEQAVEEINERLRDTSGIERELAQLRTDIAGLEGKVESLLRMAELTPSLSVARQLEKREMELDQSQRRLVELNDRSRPETLRLSAGVLRRMLDRRKDQLTKGNLATRRTLLRQVVNKIEVSRDAAKVFYSFALPTLVDYMPPTGAAINQCQGVFSSHL